MPVTSAWRAGASGAIINLRCGIGFITSKPTCAVTATKWKARLSLCAYPKRVSQRLGYNWSGGRGIGPQYPSRHLRFIRPLLAPAKRLRKPHDPILFLVISVARPAFSVDGSAKFVHALKR